MSYTSCGTESGWRSHRSANEPACSGCKSWKAKHDAGQVVEHSPKTKRQLAQCATPAGYAKHRRNGEPICRPCREAQYAKQREYEDATRERNGLPPRKRRDPNAPKASSNKQELQPCGTVAAWLRHYRAKETICDPCADAKLVADRERSKANRKGPPPREHGTEKGRGQHKYHGEEVCEPCRIAYNAAQRKRQRVRKKTNA